MTNAIDLQNVTKRYPNGKGISGVTLEVPAGQIFGFLGPNGAGKTTTIRTIMDFMRPDDGSITVLGYDAQRASVAVKERIGYVPADRQLYESWTGRQHVDLYQSARPHSTSDVAKRLNLDLRIPVRQLSTGNKQKLAITLAMCGQPELLIMDEPTAGLDPLLQQEIYEILGEYKQAGGTVFLSSHNLSEVEKICDRVGVIKDGKVVANKSMDDMRDMSIHIVSITSDKPLHFKHKDVVVMHQTAVHTELKVKGSLNPLLAYLAKHTIKDLEINHASLEDVFMEYYS